MAANNQNASDLVLIDALRSLVPINVLPTDTFDSFAEHIQVETATAGTELFHFGDSNNQVVYLLSGEVILKDHNNKFIQTIRGGSERARYPLAHELPREVTAKARTNVAYVQIDMQELNKLMSSEYSLDHQIGDIRVRDIRDVQDDDWVTFALQSFIFENLPPAKLQLILNRFITLPVKKGDIILNQGEIANYYYYIRQGRCEVTKKASIDDEAKVVAELKPGDGFGEDALIAKTKRNATVAMLSDGVLMRLSNTDFKELIEQPLLKPLAPIEMEQHVTQGAQILDVREPADYKLTHLAKSKNIPYQHFREAIDSLDPKLTYITYSNNGRRSAVASFLLMQRGINAFYLNERRQQPKYTLADTTPQREPETNIQELEKIKSAYAELQQQLQKEQQLRKTAENQTIECQDREEECIKTASQLSSEKLSQQTTSAETEHLANDIKELKAEKEDVQRQLESYYSRIENEAEHLDNEVKSIQDLEATRITALKEIEQLHADTMRAKQEAETAHRQAEYESQLLILESRKLADLNDSRMNEEKKLAELESRKLELETMLNQRDEARDELNDLSTQLEKSKKDVDVLHQQIQAETEQLSELKRQEKDQENRQKDILQNNASLEKKIEQLNEESIAAQSKTEQAQEKLQQQQTLLHKMETKAEEYKSLSEKQQSMQLELDSLVEQLKTTHQQIELAKRSGEESKLDSELSALHAKEEAAQVKAEAEELYIKAEEQAIQIKADAEQARLAAQKDIAQAKAKAEQIQLHAKAEVARIKSELALLQKQKNTTNNDAD